MCTYLVTLPGGQWKMCILQSTVSAATSLLCLRLVMAYSLQAITIFGCVYKMYVNYNSQEDNSRVPTGLIKWFTAAQEEHRRVNISNKQDN